MGCYVPAESATIGIIDAIYTRLVLCGTSISIGFDRFELPIVSLYKHWLVYKRDTEGGAGCVLVMNS